MCRKLGRQHLDAQQLRGGVLANARRGEASVKAVAGTGKQARSRTLGHCFAFFSFSFSGLYFPKTAIAAALANLQSEDLTL
jgi:hypothetical protein